MVGTRLAKELAEFTGELSLEGLHFWKTVFSAMTHPTTTINSSSQAWLDADASEASKDSAKLDSLSASDKKVILLPCRNPPILERVQLWLEARKQYESLQKGRRETGLLKKGIGLDVEGNQEINEKPAASSCPAVKIEVCDRLSSIWAQRRKKRSLSLVISPMKNIGSQCKFTEVSPLSDEGGVDIKEERGERIGDDDLATSLESLELPLSQQSYQQSQLSESSVEPLSPRLCNTVENLEGSHSPSNVSNKEEGKTSPLLTHSTPFLRKRRRSKGDGEPLCSTPISEG